MASFLGINYRPGSWFGLPEMGLTEKAASKVSGGRTSDLSQALYAKPSSAQTPTTSTSLSGGGGGSSWGPIGSSSTQKTSFVPTVNNNVPAGNQVLENNINQQVDDFGAMIDRDYDTAMSALLAQEEGLKGQAASATSQAEAGYAPARTQIANEQATNVAGVEGQVQTAETQGKTAMQQARDLFRQTQQSNIAQLSALGISSSSVAEALGERLGIETARRIAGVTGSVQEIRQNAAKELTRINTYYQGKLSDLEKQLATAKANIQQQLLSGLSQINQSRNQAASDKANRRAELISNAQSALAKLQADALNFQQSLETWNQQKQTALQPIVSDPNYLTNLQQQTSTLNQNFAPTGFSYVPNFGSTGQMTGYSLKEKKEEDDDEISQLASKYGI